jgi:hypothetical protein
VGNKKFNSYIGEIMNNEACSKDSPECCGGKGENCADKGVAAAAQPPSTNELILTLQNTVIGLQSK